MIKFRDQKVQGERRKVLKGDGVKSEFDLTLLTEDPTNFSIFLNNICQYFSQYLSIFLKIFVNISRIIFNIYHNLIFLNISHNSCQYYPQYLLILPTIIVNIAHHIR